MLDAQTRLCNNQSIAAAAGTVVSENTIDLALTGAVGTDDAGNTIYSDPGRSPKVELLCQITETVTSGGAATVQAQLITSAADNLSSPTVIASTAAIALASLVAGYQFRLEIPPGLAQRYLGVQFVIATATTTAGKVTAGIVDVKNTAYNI